jgi:small subunit ribosomal protein S17e
LGNVRTDQIKRTSKELIRRFPDKFSNNFEENKHLVSLLTQGTTIKIRNQIAGYITRRLAGEEEEIPSEALPQEQQEAAGEGQAPD